MVASSVCSHERRLPELDAAGLLAASSQAVRARRLAEVRDLGVLAQWAAVHSGDPVQRVGHAGAAGWRGHAGVQDFCLGEIALARGTGVTATANAVADILDLLFRLPQTWEVCESGEAELHIARRVAKLSRHLPADRVGVVDRAVARIIAHESGGRVLAVAEAKIIEADPALHEERVEAERRRRYVSSSRTDEYGLRTVIARVEAGDAVWVEATVARVAEILGPALPRGHRRRGPRDRVRVAGPPRRAPRAAAGAPRRAGELDLELRRARAGPPRSPPTSSTPSARST